MPARRVNPYRVKLHRLYDVRELAECLGVHKNTVRHWQRDGLKAIDDNRPTLFNGKATRAFLLARQTSRKRPCQPGTIYCFKCRESLPLKFEENENDLFGDAYEFLISNYAANAGKSGGEFFTPQHVSKLIAQLAVYGQSSVNKIYDPAAGSGSLLLQAKKHCGDHFIEEGFFGQEINYTTYNLARMNMFLHNVNYDKFNIQNGNTLEHPHFLDERPFDAIVSNPPYSVRWKGDEDPTLINDDRFAPAGVLAPKSKADFAFVLHALHYLSAKPFITWTTRKLEN